MHCPRRSTEVHASTASAAIFSFRTCICILLAQNTLHLLSIPSNQMMGKAVRRCNLFSSHLQTNTTTLCFLGAFHEHQSNRISWDEYLRHLLIHLTGVKHKEDDRDGLYPALRRTDPFGYGIFCWIQLFEQKVTGKQPHLCVMVRL